MEAKPYALTPYPQVAIAFSAMLIAASVAFAAFRTWESDRNARLVEIGIAVLRADPKKDASAASAREWALDLIDTNAGGVKFSAAARRELLQQALPFKPAAPDWSYGSSYYEPNAKSKNSN